MKFTVLNQFQSEFTVNGHTVFEVGNTHDSEILGVDPEHLKRWYRAGFVQLEGEQTAPPLNPSRVEIVVHDVNHKSEMEVSHG